MCSAWRSQPRSWSGAARPKSPEIISVLRNASLWHQQNPTERFPSCWELGPAGVPRTALCKAPPQPRAAGAQVLEGSCSNSPPPSRAGGHGKIGPAACRCLPWGRPRGLAPTGTLTCLPPRGEEEAPFPLPFLLELAARVQRYLADIWPLGFPDSDSCTHPGTAEPVVYDQRSRSFP